MILKTISLVVILLGFGIFSFAQMDMKGMDMKKDSVPASHKKKALAKINSNKAASAKKDTIKAMNDPITNMGKRKDTSSKMSNNMQGMDMSNMNMDTTKSAHHEHDDGCFFT